MTYVYHRIPKNFTGTTLYPLHEMKKSLPAIYAAHTKKYEGREILLERRIPQLDCLWNDVLHLSPVHPQKLCAALQEAGFDIQSIRCFEIDPNLHDFNANNTIIYLSPVREFGDFSIKETDFEPYGYEKLAELTEVPAATKRHFRGAKEDGKRPFLFNHIPHILFKGTIDTTKLQSVCQENY